MAAYLRLLNKIGKRDRSRLLFVTAPDVVANWLATLESFWRWLPELRGRGLPVAVVAQNGATVESIPWSEVAAVFIGGDDAWKEGPEARAILQAAGKRGVWRHVGRVNTLRRLELFDQTGVELDSFDGSGYSRYNSTIAWMLDHLDKPRQERLVWE